MAADELAETAAPPQVAADSLGLLSWVAAAVSIGGVAAMLGVILFQLLGLSRMVFAMARRGDLPRFLEHVHPRYGIPSRAVLGAIAAVIAATGTLRDIACWSRESSLRAIFSAWTGVIEISGVLDGRPTSSSYSRWGRWSPSSFLPTC